MAIVQKITCDVCGAERKEANHWWMGEEGNSFSSPKFHDWDETLLATSMHICGEECAHAAISAWFSQRMNSRVAAGRPTDETA